MTALNRELQLRVLRHLMELYPNQEFRMDRAFKDVDRADLTANVRYLYEHGLVFAGWTETNTGGVQHGGAYLTAKGADFLADDGGLSAILGVVTVKLHSDSIKALLTAHIEKSDADPSVKASLIAKIKSLPAAALEAVILEGLAAGMTYLPDTAGWLQKLLFRQGGQ